MKTTTLTLLFFVTIVSIHAQNVITVDNTTGSNAQYDNLQSAISAATAGDIIHVMPSETSYGNVTIEKTLTLIGFAHSDPDKRSILGSVQLTTGADNTRLTSLELRDTYSVRYNTVPLTGLIVENCLLEELYFYNAGADDILIRGNVFDYIGYGSTTSSYSNAIITNNIILRQVVVINYQSVTVKNNIFSNPVSTNPVYNRGYANGGISVQNNIFYYSTSATRDPNVDGVIFENCLTYNIGTGNVASLNGTNNLDNRNPLFLEDNDNAAYDPITDDYKFETGSPAIDAGVNGEDIGLYDDSSFTFNNLGFSNGIPTVSIEAISTTVAPGQNLNVIISTTNN